MSGGAGDWLDGPGVDAAGVTLSRCGGGGMVLFGTGGDMWECGVRDAELARTVMESLGGDLERLVPTDSAFSGVCGAGPITGIDAKLPMGNEVAVAAGVTGATGGGKDTGVGVGGVITFWGVVLRLIDATLFTCCFLGLAEFPLITGATATGGTGDFDTTRLALVGVGCGFGGEAATA